MVQSLYTGTAALPESLPEDIFLVGVLWEEGIAGWRNTTIESWKKDMKRDSPISAKSLPVVGSEIWGQGARSR
jgi:hypothetical protein